MVTIREATPDDAVAFAAIVRACWRLVFRGIIPDSVLDRPEDEDIAERAARIRGRMVDGWRSYAAEHAGRIVGVARLAMVPVHGYDAEIDGLHVDPAAHRQGIGRALVRHACDHFAAHHERTLYIHVLRGNTGARAFYEAIGGTIVVEDTWSYAGVPHPAIGYAWADVAQLAGRLRTAP
ncbi:MAG: GNAT family N-acetyltransferase [Deltaproteobacteria bacterium]|nr:GNAT family N-acetyltransferase [Deltaproteobacteria bacterium]MDQ3296275.1 GNAT family N-acetyltransferase [Myxococcota bacterium]